MNANQKTDLYYSFSFLSDPELDFYRQGLADFLRTEDQTEYSRFKVAKRQNEWISSRITTKKMMVKILNDKKIAIRDIRIQKETNGRPYIFVDGKGRLNGSFSLSHSQGMVFCGYSDAPDMHFGIDLEKIEERKLEFIMDYFTNDEIKNYQQCTSDQKKEYSTLIWSAKEAALKAIGKGLALDTRKVEVIPQNVVSLIEGWKMCNVIFREGSEKEYTALWQEKGGFIRTISVPAGDPIHLSEIDLEK